jgi:hypothetical protein
MHSSWALEKAQLFPITRFGCAAVVDASEGNVAAHNQVERVTPV